MIDTTNLREGVTAVEEPVDCPNVSKISCKYAFMFQDFLQLSSLPAWNRVDNSGFWRQFTVCSLSAFKSLLGASFCFVHLSRDNFLYYDYDCHIRFEREEVQLKLLH
jgi:hypothetical protein